MFIFHMVIERFFILAISLYIIQVLLSMRPWK